MARTLTHVGAQHAGRRSGHHVERAVRRHQGIAHPVGHVRRLGVHHPEPDPLGTRGEPLVEEREGAGHHLVATAHPGEGNDPSARVDLQQRSDVEQPAEPGLAARDATGAQEVVEGVHREDHS
jgi:hypothetical protein